MNSSKKTAFLFPGQGSQCLGMLESFCKHESAMIPWFEKASQQVGYDMLRLVKQGSFQAISQTTCTQPLLLTMSVALWHLWKKYSGITPHFLLGNSLGEYTAYVCAESFEFEAAVQLVAKRGAYMQAAVQDVRSGMGIIIGLNYEEVAALCDREIKQVVAPTNYNTANQIVIGGHLPAVHRVMRLAKAQGARFVKQLPISVPAHCDLMQPAVQPLRVALEKIQCRLPRIPVVSNQYSIPLTGVASIKQSLVMQLCQPVLWVNNIQFLLGEGVDCFIECGPGQVLMNLVHSIATRPVEAISIGNYQSFQKALALVTG